MLPSDEKEESAYTPDDESGGQLKSSRLARKINKNTILSEFTFRSRAAAGRSYRIIRTDQQDAYEDRVPRGEIAERSAAMRAAPAGDEFKGKARKAAKLSIADAEIEVFEDLKDLIDSLTADEDMIAHDPTITTAQTSDRVEEEKRNIRVNTFLYAASREDDNDFHLILGRDPGISDEMYMNMELSGLPPSTSPFFDTLKDVRDTFKDFFSEDMPGPSYDFFVPPIPVIVEGSLFFDMNHSSGQKPGPADLRDDIPTIWEVHPITRMDFEP